jgi:plasmid stabilization system protein ParE
MRVRVLPEASQDIVMDAQYHESQSPGLGKYFTKCIHQELRRLQRHAGIHAKDRGYHRMIARRFSLVIYYKIEDGIAVVVAIVDNRRDPEWIANRLAET